MTRNGSTRRWRQLRALVLAQQPYCQIRGPGCTGLATTVDHIVPISQGGAMYDLANLRAACAYENYARGDGTRGRDINRRREHPPSRNW